MQPFNNFVQGVIIIIAALLLQTFLPWWTLGIPCLLISLMYGKSGKSSFIVGFASIAILWILSSVWIQFNSESKLTEQVSLLFPGKSVFILYLLTGLVGGLTGGFCSLSGFQIRRLL